MIQKPQKEHPLKAYAKASLKSHEGKEREKRAKENQLNPGPENFLWFGITSENNKNKDVFRVNNLFPWSIHTNRASC